MHIIPPCIMCSNDVDFLCKCLNLLYLIKELILCDLTMIQVAYLHYLSFTDACFSQITKHTFSPQYMFIMSVIKPVGIRNTAANGSGMHTLT